MYKKVIIETSIWYDREEPFPEGEALYTCIEELINGRNYVIKTIRDIP